MSPLYFFPEKPGELFLLIAVTITIAFYCFHSGVTPSRVSPPHLFYLSDFVSPLFFVNLLTEFFSFGCHPLKGVTRGGPLPLVTPLYVVVFVIIWLLAFECYFHVFHMYVSVCVCVCLCGCCDLCIYCKRLFLSCYKTLTCCTVFLVFIT